MPEARPAAAHVASSKLPRVGPKVWWLGLVTMLLVSGLLSLSAYREGLPAVFERVVHLDKALHFTLAGGLAFFLDGVLRRRVARVGGLAVPLSALALLGPLAVEELLQRFSVNRSSSLGDYLADVAGVSTMIWLSRRVDR